VDGSMVKPITDRRARFSRTALAGAATTSAAQMSFRKNSPRKLLFTAPGERMEASG
jgi:hypothetical protein